MGLQGFAQSQVATRVLVFEPATALPLHSPQRLHPGQRREVAAREWPINEIDLTHLCCTGLGDGKGGNALTYRGQPTERALRSRRTNRLSACAIGGPHARSDTAGGSGSRLNKTIGRELLIHQGHGRAGQASLCGQCTRRGQGRAHGVSTVGDPSSQLLVKGAAQPVLA